MQATSFRRVDSPGAARSPNPSSAVAVSRAAHSPVAVKPRHPARAADTATRSSPDNR